MTFLDLSGLGRLQSKLDQVKRLSPVPFAKTAMDIIVKDNRDGVLMGLDKDGRSMDPVQYRPVNARPKKLTLAQKNTNNSRQRKGAFSGFGPAAAGLHNNLSRSEYEHLAGPPLAPRGAFSRVITNLRTEFNWDPATRQLRVSAAWFDVVSQRGVPFLKAHFEGLRVGRGKGVKLPKRDLRGVRPTGMNKARTAFVAWAADQIRYKLRTP